MCLPPRGLRGSGTAGVRIGVLIAGGAGRRAGVDKRFLVLEGRTLLSRNLAFLHELFPAVAVVIGRGQELDLGDDVRADVLEDAWPGSSPLVGLVTALARYREPVFAMAADIAFPQREAARAVVAAARGHDAALPCISAEWRQPLFAVYGPRCLKPMVALVESGRHRIVDALVGLSVARVPFSDDALFHNINTIDDYREARRRAQVGEDGPERDPALVLIVDGDAAGRTSLIEDLARQLAVLGLRVGTLAPGDEGLELARHDVARWSEKPGGPQGCEELTAPPHLVTGASADLPLPRLARRHFGGFDLVVAVADRPGAPAWIQVLRGGVGRPVPTGSDDALALVTDTAATHAHRYALRDAEGLARFLAQRLHTLREY